jgi:hypothetical protein
MTGKEYVTETKERLDKLLADMKTKPEWDTDSVLVSLSKAGALLDGMKNKATLKTRPGTNLAFPVYDGISRLEEAWEEDPSGDTDDFKTQIEEFITVVETLNAALKERTVIMT